MTKRRRRKYRPRKQTIVTKLKQAANAILGAIPPLLLLMPLADIVWKNWGNVSAIKSEVFKWYAGFSGGAFAPGNLIQTYAPAVLAQIAIKAYKMIAKM